MKKLVLMALPAIALLAGCSKTEITPAQTDPQQITFQTITGRQGTKANAIISGTDYPTDETFGTFVYFNSEKGKFPTNAESYIPESEVKYNTPTNGYWSTVTPYYWPKQGYLTFFSYSPYDELNAVTNCSTADGVTISSWDVDAKQTVDVMVADVMKDQQKANVVSTPYKGVNTVFRHKLSQIVKFNFKTIKDYANGHDGTTDNNYKAGDKRFYINSIAINNINHVGKYVSGNNVDATNLGSWSVTDTTDVKNYTWYAETAVNAIEFDEKGKDVAANGFSDRSYLLVLPQDFTKSEKAADGKNIQISYTIETFNGTDWSTEKVKDVYASLWAIQGGKDATDASAAVAATPWEMNKKISYNITISLEDDQIFWAPSVVDWETKDFSYVIAY